MGQQYSTPWLNMQMRFEVLAALSVRIWFPGMLYCMVSYTATNILEAPGTFILRVDKCVTTQMMEAAGFSLNVDHYITNNMTS
jgi:hypothetical protein